MPRIDCCMRTCRCFLWICIAQSFAGCARGDDPQVVRLIEKHVPPLGIRTKTDEHGAKFIITLGLPDNLAALEVLPHLGKLSRLAILSISYKGLTNDDLKALPALPTLREFRMGKNFVTDEGLKSLGGMKELRVLSLSKTRVSGPGLDYLKDSSKLERLDMSGTPLGDRGIAHVVKNFKKLRKLFFDDTNVTVDGFMQLADLHWLMDIEFPREIIGSHDDVQSQREAKRKIFQEYVAAYKESKRKARAAGEEVPPDHVSPFGPIE